MGETDQLADMLQGRRFSGARAMPPQGTALVGAQTPWHYPRPELSAADLDNSWAAGRPYRFVGSLEMTDSGNFLRRPDGQVAPYNPSTDTVDRATGGVYQRRVAPLNPEAARAAEGANVFGRALGALGLDDERGTRRNTPWGEAWANTHGGMSLANALQSGFTAADRLMTETPVGRQDPTNPILGFETAGTFGAAGAPTAMAGGMPRGALGTFGSRPARSLARQEANPAWSPDEVMQLLRESGAVNVDARPTGPHGTVYIRYDSPDNPRRSGYRESTGAAAARPTVRIPTDPDRHAGIPQRAGERGGNLFDTGAYRPDWPGDPATTTNAGGGRYADWENLADAIKWRLSRSPDGQWLISPDQAPQGLREAPLVAPHSFREWWTQLSNAQRNQIRQSKQQAKEASAMPGPVQERLLSTGTPVPSLADLLRERQGAADWAVAP